MYDYNSYPTYSTFLYWFIRKTQFQWDVVIKEHPESVIQTITEFGDKLQFSVPDDANNDMISHNFDLFKQRPEYIVGTKVTISDSMDANIDIYEKLVCGVTLCRLYETDNGRDLDRFNSHSAVDWLRSTDMYTAPASTQYHESYVGGLLYHTLSVYNNIVDLKNCEKFKTVSYLSLSLVSLVHDWCKIGLYESYNRNVKNDDTGKWKQVTAFRHNQTGVPMGHGATSMFLASRLFKLSVEEALSIRWHQGRWNVCREEMNELQLANEKSPLVHMLQFADQLAITQY